MHLPTVVILALVINLIVGFYLYLLYRRKPKDRCFRLWSFSSISFVLGGTLVALRQYDIPAFFTFFIADCLLLLAPLFVLAGLIQFSRFRYTRRRRQQVFAVLALITIAFLSVYQQPGTWLCIKTNGFWVNIVNYYTD